MAQSTLPGDANGDDDNQIDVSDVMLLVYLVLHGNEGMGPGSVEDPDVDGN